MKSTTYLLILSMACGDLVIASWTGATLIRYLLPKSVSPIGSFGIVLCKTSLYIGLVSFLACIFSLVGITIDRFMAVSRPLKHKPWSKWTKITIPVIWATSFLLPVGTLLEIDEIPSQSGDTTCSATMSHANFIILASCFLLPFALMSVLYPLISYRLWKRKVPGEFNARQQQIANHTARRVTFMMITVIVIFFICWAPQFVFSWLHLFAKQLAMKAPIWLIPFIILLKIFNGAVNPFVYAVFNESFRKGFRDILGCDKLREHNTRDLGLQQCANTQTKREPAQHVQLLNFNSITYSGMYEK